MPKYLVHIGPHKTGTSYLQSCFRTLRGDLLERGVLWPEYWSSSADDPTHLRLVAKLRERDKSLGRQFAELNRSDYDCILISSEDLSALPPDGIAYLRELVGESPVTVIFYCRNWSSLIQSVFQEHVKQGYLITLPEYFADISANPWISPVMNFALVVGAYAKAFTTLNVRLVSYSELADNEINISQHFLQTFVNWSPPPPIADARLNASLDPVDVEIIRALNAIAWRRGLARGVELRDRFLARRHEFEIDSLRKKMRRCLTTIEMDEAAPHLARLHRRLFEELGSLMVEPRPPGSLFRPKTGTLTYVAHKYLFDEEALRTLFDVYDALQRDRRQHDRGAAIT